MLSWGHCLIDVCQNLSNSSLLQKKKMEGRKEREAKEEATCLLTSVLAHQSREKSLIHTEPFCSWAQQTAKQHGRLAFPSDNMTTRVSIKGGAGNAAAAALAGGIE